MPVVEYVVEAAVSRMVVAVVEMVIKPTKAMVSSIFMALRVCRTKRIADLNSINHYVYFEVACLAAMVVLAGGRWVIW